MKMRTAGVDQVELHLTITIQGDEAVVSRECKWWTHCGSVVSATGPFQGEELPAELAEALQKLFAYENATHNLVSVE